MQRAQRNIYADVKWDLLRDLLYGRGLFRQFNLISINILSKDLIFDQQLEILVSWSPLFIYTHVMSYLRQMKHFISLSNIHIRSLAPDGSSLRCILEPHNPEKGNHPKHDLSNKHYKVPTYSKTSC